MKAYTLFYNFIWIYYNEQAKGDVYMYIKKAEDTKFGFGQIGDDKLIGYISEFEYEDNKLLKKLSLPTYVDQETGSIVYLYKDKIVTFKEFQKEYLKEYYKIK